MLSNDAFRCKKKTSLFRSWSSVSQYTRSAAIKTLHDTKLSRRRWYSLSCGRTISPLCQWSLRWKEGSWRNAGWSGSAWRTPRSSSCRQRWPGRWCCQTTRSIKPEIYVTLRCFLTKERIPFNGNIVFSAHKKVLLWRQTLFWHHKNGAKINVNICGE